MAAETCTASDQKPVKVNVAVREVQPIQIRYGASYDTERGLGGIFDISNTTRSAARGRSACGRATTGSCTRAASTSISRR